MVEEFAFKYPPQSYVIDRVEAGDSIGEFTVHVRGKWSDRRAAFNSPGAVTGRRVGQMSPRPGGAKKAMCAVESVVRAGLDERDPTVVEVDEWSGRGAVCLLIAEHGAGLTFLQLCALRSGEERVDFLEPGA